MPKLKYQIMKSFKLFFVVLSVLFLSSCTFTEELTFNQDGSGKYNLNMDMSAMTAMMGTTKDSAQAEAMEKKDTLINFKDLIKENKAEIDTMSEESKMVIESLENMKMRMQMDEAKGLFLVDMFIDFKKINEIQNINEVIAKAQSLQSEQLNEAPSNQKTTFEYTKKMFKRKVELIKLSSEDQKKFDENKAQYAMFMAGSKYKLKYTFPKKIKKVNIKEAAISEDRKTVTYEVDFEKALNDPKSLELEVKF